MRIPGLTQLLLGAALISALIPSGPTGASVLQDALDAMPPNSWQRINVNSFSDVWTPNAQRPTLASPSTNISSWSGAAWDSRRKNLVIWGGNIGDEQGNEAYVFSAVTGLWERGALPSQIKQVNGLTQTVDGIHSAPISGESWDNLVYLPGVDRIAIIGVSREGRTFQDPADGEATGPYFWDPDRADPDKVSGLTGSHVSPTSFPDVLGGEMWQNRDNFPDSFRNAVKGVTAVDSAGGADIVYFAGRYDLLWRYTVRDLDPANDTWEQIGVRTATGADGDGAADFDPTRGILVKTLGPASFGFWDVDRPGSHTQNYQVVVTPTVLSGTPPVDFRDFGLQYDPNLDAFVLWVGDEEVWVLEPPADMDPDGDGVMSEANGWTLAPLSPSGQGPTLPGAYTGVFGKWRYLPDVQAYLGVIDPESGDVFLYKPPYNTARPPTEISDLVLEKREIAGCETISATVILTAPAGPGGFDITISDDLSAADMPGVVHLAEGATSTSFVIATTPVTARQSGSILATGAHKTLSRALNVRPIGVEAIRLSPASLVGGAGTLGRLDLECAAAPGPIDVQLMSSAPAFAVPLAASMTVPQGLSSLSFDVATSPVADEETVAITGAAHGVSGSGLLVVRPSNYRPTVSLTVPVDGASYRLGAAIELAAAAGDLDGTVTRVEFYSDSQKLAEDTTAPYEHTWSGAPAGDIVLTAVAFDDGGASATSGPVTITVTDAPNEPPVVSLTSPIDGGSYLLGSPIDLAATASDSDGAIARVEFYQGLVRLHEATSAPYAYSWLGAPQGTHLLTAIAYDDEGASTSSAAVMVTVASNSGSETTITLQDGLYGYSGTRDSYVYEVNQSNNFGSLERLQEQNRTDKRFRSLVRFAIFQSEGGPVPDGATITSATLGLYKYSSYDHSYQLRPLLTDWVESEVTWQQSRLGLAWVGPGATAIGSDVGGVPDAVAYVQSSPDWLEFNVTGSVQAIAAGRANYGWILDPISGNGNIKRFHSREYASVPSMRPRLVVRYSGGSGNLRPSVALTAPADGSIYLPGNPIAISATASDPDGTIARVEFHAGATKLGEDATAPYEYTWTSAPVGSHVLTAMAFDDVGASSTSTPVGIAVSSGTANLPPAVALTAPADGSSYLSGDPITMTATASDPDGTIARVEFYRGLTRLGEDATAPYEYTWTNAPEGQHLLTAVAYDNDGDSASATAVMVTVTGSTGNDTTVTLQDGLDGYSGTRDSYIYEVQPSNNFGSLERLQEQNRTDKRFRSLVRFAIFASEGGPVPDGATITSATLGLYKYSSYDHSYQLRPLLTDWVESEVTWQQSRLGLAWVGPGATAPGSDLADLPDALGAAPWAPGWVEFDVTGAVQAIAAGRANYGWILDPISGNGNIKRFHSREHAADTAVRPRLTISYR